MQIARRHVERCRSGIDFESLESGLAIDIAGRREMCPSRSFYLLLLLLLLLQPLLQLLILLGVSVFAVLDCRVLI